MLRLLIGILALIALCGTGLCDQPLEIKIGYLHQAPPRIRISLIDVPAANDGLDCNSAQSIPSSSCPRRSPDPRPSGNAEPGCSNTETAGPDPGDSHPPPRSSGWHNSHGTGEIEVVQRLKSLGQNQCGLSTTPNKRKRALVGGPVRHSGSIPGIIRDLNETMEPGTALRTRLARSLIARDRVDTSESRGRSLAARCTPFELRKSRRPAESL